MRNLTIRARHRGGDGAPQISSGVSAPLSPSGSLQHVRLLDHAASAVPVHLRKIDAEFGRRFRAPVAKRELRLALRDESGRRGGAQQRHSLERRFAFAANRRQQRADRQLLSRLDEDLIDDASLENFDFDEALVGFDFGDDVAALDGVARLDAPVASASPLPCRRRGWACGTHPFLRTIFLAAATMVSACGSAACSRCFA